MAQTFCTILLLVFLSCGNTAKQPEPTESLVLKPVETVEPTTQEVVAQNIDTVSPIKENLDPKEHALPLETKEEEAPSEADNKPKVPAAQENRTVVVETVVAEEEKERVATVPTDHAVWNTLLKKYVDNDGNVDYAAFQKEQQALKAYVADLGDNAPKNTWGKNKKLAYYINLYNAATVLLIVENYPTKSIKDIPNRWKRKWIAVGSGITSLNDIEHKVLRKMNEPRIHFAINCASYSCPKLLNTAFTETNMEMLLEQATSEFINDPKRNRFTANEAQLSKIFKWYKSDFTSKTSLLGYITPYLKKSLAKNAEIDYLDYDWSLNEAK